MVTEAQTVFLEKWERGTSLNFVEFIEFCPRRCRKQQEALCRTRHLRFRMINFYVFLSVITKILLKLKPANMVIFTALKFFRSHYTCFCTTSLYKTISLDGIRVHLWGEEMEDWCCRSHAWLVSRHRSLNSQARASNPALALRRLERVFRCCSVCETMEDYKEGYFNSVDKLYISSQLYCWAIL